MKTKPDVATLSGAQAEWPASVVTSPEWKAEESRKNRVAEAALASVRATLSGEQATEVQKVYGMHVGHPANQNEMDEGMGVAPTQRSGEVLTTRDELCDYLGADKQAAAKEADRIQGSVPQGHASDCAVHNMPAMPNGPCDCGLGSVPSRKDSE